jgi:hypothetical protein
MLGSMGPHVEKRGKECATLYSVEGGDFLQSQPCFRKDRLSFSAILASTLAARRIPP